jgi:hypothetical protein
VPDEEISDFHGIYCFVRKETLIVVVSADLVNRFRGQAASWCAADVLDEKQIRKLISQPVDRVIGPTFIGYTDRLAFRPVSIEGVRFLATKDNDALEGLRAVCSVIE